LTVLNLAIPHLSAALKPSGAELLWIVDIYGFMLACSLITVGALGDRFGRRKLLLIGAAGFGIASVLAAFSTTPLMLIATRALLSLGAVLAVIYGLKQVVQDGLTASNLLAIASGLLLAAIFVRRQRRLADPLVDLSLFGNPRFSVSVTSNVINVFVSFGSFIL